MSPSRVVISFTVNNKASYRSGVSPTDAIQLVIRKHLERMQADLAGGNIFILDLPSIKLEKVEG